MAALRLFPLQAKARAQGRAAVGRRFAHALALYFSAMASFMAHRKSS